MGQSLSLPTDDSLVPEMTQVDLGAASDPCAQVERTGMAQVDETGTGL